MSDCRHGGRDAYERPSVREYDQMRPIRGRFVFDDGTSRPYTMARYINGVERRISAIEVDGKLLDVDSIAQLAAIAGRLADLVADLRSRLGDDGR